jgi:outer membrane lipoprotein LolB
VAARSASISRRRILVAGLSLAVTACAIPMRPAAPGPTRPLRTSIAAFSLDGRIAAHRGDKSFAVSVSWQHTTASDNLLFSGPLGQGLAELVRDERGARLTLSDRREFVAGDLEELSAKVFGFPLPLSDMAHWVVGDAHGGTIAAADEAGRPRRLAAAGWSIDLLDWESEAAEALPTQLELRRDDIDVRLRIIDWQDVR